MLRVIIALCMALALVPAVKASAAVSGSVPPERCQGITDRAWFKELTHRTTMHEDVKLDLCYIPGGWFTRIRPDSVSVLNMTCGTLCTYPYVTSVESPPAMRTTYRGARASLTTQFKVEVCPVFGIACTFTTYFTLTTDVCMNGAGQGRRPDRGTATLYIWKCGSHTRKGL